VAFQGHRRRPPPIPDEHFAAVKQACDAILDQGDDKMARLSCQNHQEMLLREEDIQFFRQLARQGNGYR